ncbi:MAG: TldD/PmbA family protein [Promethearchaeota archaeon]|nr:MAG: TldD/PmbA family protein [Candidatus Lokiarchaeota archaeon]
MIEKTRNLIEKKLKELNVDKWDLLINKTSTFENQFRGIDIEITRDYEIISYIIRVFDDREKEMGIGELTGSSVKKKNIEKSIKHAIKMSKINSSTKYGLNQPGLKYEKLKLYEDKIISDPHGFLKDRSEKLTSIISQQKNVAPTFGKFRIYIKEKKLTNSLGINLDTKSTSLFIEYAIKAESNGNLAEYWAKSYFKNSDQLDLNNRVKKWASIAYDTIKAKEPEQNKSAVVLFPPIILKDAFKNTIGFHITGKSKVEKLNKIEIGEKIASESFTLHDNGLLDGGLNSNPWDGEGTPQRNTLAIKNGIFKERIFDLKHAKILNDKSTGNGLRTEGGSIENTFTNLEINPGDQKLDDIISEISNGLLIEEFSWLNPNRITGDFGAEIRNGYLIKKGEISNPIKGGNLSGNVFEMINNITNISKERKFEENVLLPYILCENLILSS